jgi:23S rRNA (adenine2503-C2)-methyltransferase
MIVLKPGKTELNIRITDGLKLEKGKEYTISGRMRSSIKSLVKSLHRKTARKQRRTACDDASISIMVPPPHGHETGPSPLISARSIIATGQAGLTRNLTAGEITAQVVAAARICAAGELPGGETRLSNVVFMGMGEPMANYNSVMRSIRNITTAQPDGLGISARSVTLSTVGLVNGIEKLCDEGIPVTLAVSLHTPDDELRDSLVPINNRFNVREVLAAADAYEKKTGRRYSIEYALIRDINDQSWRSDLLGRLLKNRNAHVNLIPLNPTPGSKWTASRREDESEFVRILESYGVPVTVRDTRGREIDGACGQLAASENAKN